MFKIKLFKIYISNGCKDLYIPIKVIYIQDGIKIFVYSYKDFMGDWRLSDILYESEDDFDKYTTKYDEEIDYHKLFKCVFKYDNITEYGDKI